MLRRQPVCLCLVRTVDYPFAPPSAFVQQPWNETAAAFIFCYFKPPVLLEAKVLAVLETVVLSTAFWNCARNYSS